MMRSLQNRLIAATLVAMLLILLGAAALIYGMIRGALVAEFDETLLAKAKAISALAEEDERRFELDLAAAQMPEFELGNRCEYFQVSGGDDTTLSRSPSLMEDLPGIEAAGEVPSFLFTVLPDGRPGRQITLVTRIRTDLGEEGEAEGSQQAVVKIAVARDTLDLNPTLDRLALLLASVTLGAALLSVVILIIIVRSTLKPVGTLAAQIAEIDASNVSKKGELVCSIEELDPVVDRLNELLIRLNTAFIREKAFTADVAHELRTPLAGLSAALEVCSSRPRDEAAYREVIIKCLGTTRAMQSMVENLLALARVDAGQLTLRRESLDLLRFARECWVPFEAKATERELQVTWRNNDRSIDLATDRDMIRLVLSNLFDNVVRHCDHGGTVSIEITSESNEVSLEIRNTGCNLSPDEAGSVFERFWKHNTARTEGPAHCGLGLTLCRRIADALGGSITATATNGTFAVRFVLTHTS
jgi:two-component system heavy metal sensor histidine kinase CusS